MKIVFQKFAEFGLLVNLGKCQFIQESVTFLGHILSGEGKVQEILRFSVPKTCSEVKSFLGMASFFRKFVRHFSECAAPLFELLKKSRLFEWTDECESGFNFIKSKLQDARILVHPQFDRPFIIHRDASGKAIGFMLAQMYNNMLKPMFGGRVLSEAEQRYATADKELLTCYFATKKCEIYVLGYDFIVYTDHKPLINLKGFKDVVNRRYRWIEYLESMSVRLRYLPGAENIVADFISRNINEGAKLDVIRFNVPDMTSVVFDRNDLIASQYNDSDLLKTIEIMQGNSTNEFPKCYRRHKNKLLTQDDMLKY